MFEVLHGLPAYGALPKLINHTGSSVYREGFVVRFLSGTDREWVGNFQRGLCSFDCAIPHPNGEGVLVIAGGTAYIVDPSSQSVAQSFGGQIESCLPAPDVSGLLLSNGLWVELIDSEGLAWQSRRLAWDGLCILAICDGEVLGEAAHYDGSWHTFRVRLSDGQASGGAYDGPEP